MNIDIKVDEKLIIDMITDYCHSRLSTCPDNCIFDKLGYCTGDKGFNSMKDKYEEELDNAKD